MKKTRNILTTIISFVLLVTMALTLGACNNGAPGGSGGGDEDVTVIVKLNKTLLELDEQSSDYQLVATVKEDGKIISNPALTWTSSNNNVVTVSNTGVVHVVGVGETAINCTYDDDNVASCRVVVSKYYEPEFKVVLVSKKLAIPYDAGYEFTIQYTVEYNDGTLVEGATVTYSSSDALIATVDPSTGKITVVGRGDCYITITAVKGDKIAAADFLLSVERVDTEGGFGEDKPWA